ncbi:MAG TPA: MATE family efflux transporter [Spirochaetota bacterium]|nr:MATE family efflux transporter [Spirochaetota bacterium]HOM37786.1 MATE family efflux transporter [Spirochaetota bacterium]HPQ49337.1 MATE family efflux transporter [Spirochaetota bacterium]
MKDMTKGSIISNIINFSIPLILGNILMQFYNIVDAIIIGKFVGKEGLSAVGASFPIIFLIIAMMFGFTMGATILASQFYGAKNIEKLKKLNGTLYYFLFLFSLVITIAGTLLSKNILKLINTPDNIIEDATKYLRINFLTSVLLIGFHGLSSTLRGIGDSKTPLYLLIFSSLLNIILDLLFVVYFNWGIEGAAWATAISEGIGLITGIIILEKKNSILKIDIKYLRLDFKLLKIILKLGIPTGVQQIAVALGFAGLTKIVNNFGVDALTAFTAAGRIDSLAMMPAMSFSAALSTFTGQNIGKDDIKRAKKGISKTLLISITYSFIIVIIVNIFGTDIIKLFNNEINVINIGHQYLVIVTSFYIAFSIMFVFHGFLRGVGDTLIPMFITIISLWALRIPISYILSKKIGVVGIWWGIPIAWVMGAILSFLYYKLGKWENKITIKRFGKEKVEQIEIAAKVEALEYDKEKL